MGLKQFVYEIKTIKLKASDKMELQRLAATRFPKLAARGGMRVVVFDDEPDYYGLARQRHEGASYTITDLELPRRHETNAERVIGGPLSRVSHHSGALSFDPPM